jgi:hypothetical protein
MTRQKKGGEVHWEQLRLRTDIIKFVLWKDHPSCSEIMLKFVGLLTVVLSFVK